MAQLKDTTVSGGLSVSGSISGNGGQLEGDLTLHSSSGDSPSLVFLRGTVTDNYNDWKIVDSSGIIYFQERGLNSTGWNNRASINSSGGIVATTFNGQLVGTISSSTTATTQTSGDNSTKVATTAFVQDAVNSGGSGIEFVVGTQNSTTGSWTGATTDSALTDGKMIDYFLPYAGSGNATLNLTLSGGTTTGAKNCYFTGTERISTHFPANSHIMLVYHSALNIGGTSYEGWWVTMTGIMSGDSVLY